MSEYEDCACLTIGRPSALQWLFRRLTELAHDRRSVL